MNKQKLIIKEWDAWLPPGDAVKSVRFALPYYTSPRSKYVHRVRSAQQFWSAGVYSHTAIKYWCGNIGTIGKRGGTLHAKVPDGEVLCSTCEGRAIGAGMDGSRIINGRPVMYSPKEGT